MLPVVGMYVCIVEGTNLVVGMYVMLVVGDGVEKTGVLGVRPVVGT